MAAICHADYKPAEDGAAVSGGPQVREDFSLGVENLELGVNADAVASLGALAPAVAIDGVERAFLDGLQVTRT